LADEFILETEGLTKEFAGFFAVRDVALKVRRGSIHALIGPNGAGKTTCFNLLTKFLKPSAGKILYKGQDITAMAPADVARMGLVRSFQISAVFPHLTALENVRVALQRQHGSSFDFWRSKSVLNGYNHRAQELLNDVGLSEFANTPAVEMPYGRTGDRDHARARPGDDAAGRADGRHGPRGHRQDRGADQAHLGEIHHPDGRA
jgi:branched-chain amino acid transport system ATP-binding protein